MQGHDTLKSNLRGSSMTTDTVQKNQTNTEEEGLII